MASYNLAENYDITKSKIIPKFSNIIQLSIVEKKRKNIGLHPCMTLHAQYIFSNIQRTQSSFKSTDVETHVTIFSYINSSFCDANFMITKEKKETKTNNMYLEYSAFLNAKNIGIWKTQYKTLLYSLYL